MGSNGRLTRKQIKGIFSTHCNKEFVSEGDLNAVMRRMDADGDEELSFSDFFASLLPYFIYGNMRDPSTTDELVK